MNLPGQLTTPVGRQFRDAPVALWTAAVIAAVVVAIDMVVVRHLYGPEQYIEYGAVAAAVAVYLSLARGDPVSVSLVLTPVQGWWYWVKATLLIGLIMGCLLGALCGVSAIVVWSWPIPQVRPQEMNDALCRMCVWGPVREEAIYRLVLCVPLAVLLRPWGAVVASWVLFAASHWIGGNPGPDNQLAGFFLAWAYLKSGTILVPVGLHSLGNLIAVSTHVLAYQWNISRFP
jgi:membrane protease YdiL (CAAX protease family)